MIIYPDHHSQQVYYTTEQAKQAIPQFAHHCLQKHNTTTPLHHIDIITLTLTEP